MLTLQSEIQEVERLGLEEPLQLTQDITIKVGKDGAVKMSDSEVGQRFRQTRIVQEIYMGQFEVSDAAVNLAMMSLREQSDEGSKDVVKDLEATGVVRTATELLNLARFTNCDDVLRRSA